MLDIKTLSQAMTAFSKPDDQISAMVQYHQPGDRLGVSISAYAGTMGSLSLSLSCTIEDRPTWDTMWTLIAVLEIPTLWWDESEKDPKTQGYYNDATDKTRVTQPPKTTT